MSDTSNKDEAYSSIDEQIRHEKTKDSNWERELVEQELVGVPPNLKLAGYIGGIYTAAASIMFVVGAISLFLNLRYDYASFTSKEISAIGHLPFGLILVVVFYLVLPFLLLSASVSIFYRLRLGWYLTLFVAMDGLYISGYITSTFIQQGLVELVIFFTIIGVIPSVLLLLLVWLPASKQYLNRHVEHFDN